MSRTFELLQRIETESGDLSTNFIEDAQAILGRRDTEIALPVLEGDSHFSTREAPAVVCRESVPMIERAIAAFEQENQSSKARPSVVIHLVQADGHDSPTALSEAAQPPVAKEITPSPPKSEAIYRDPPVARAANRVKAEVAHASMVLIGLALFLGSFYVAGGVLLLTKENVSLLALGVVLVTLFYRFLWVAEIGQTQGLRFADRQKTRVEMGNSATTPQGTIGQATPLPPSSDS